jgi:tRNA1(Val) A37 N6-methylase TrmN6
MNLNFLSDLQALSDFLQSKISSFKPEREDFDYTIENEPNFSNLQKIGAAELSDTEELLAFTCKYNGELTARSAKKKQYEIAKKVLKEDFKDGAIFVFFDDTGNFRFSFIRRFYGEETKKYSNWKRYTYYVDPTRQNKTFKKRIGGADYSSLDSIQKAFSVEPLSKDFYRELSHWYFASFAEVEFPNDRGENEHNLKANAMIRLITRLMFVWFMKQKQLVPQGLFDQEKLDDLLDYKDKNNSTYYKAILQNLFFATLNTELGEKRKWVGRSNYGVQNYYRYRRFIKDEKQFMDWMNQIPFLNGGLFENLDIVETADKKNNIEKKDIRVDCFSDNPKNEARLKVPDYLFFGTRKADISEALDDKSKTAVEIKGIIDILNQYDFTIDENTPDDVEVALDPELLGTVFENLLASYNPETQSTARKESGSFYTPRPIVDYMVRESLEYYLEEATAVAKDKLKQLSDDKEEHTLTDKERDEVIYALSEIKILDPACGSGAFPMGCLQHIVMLLNKLDPENTKWKEAQVSKLKNDLKNAIDNSDNKEFDKLKKKIDQVFSNQYNDADYARKLYLIQNCLYGVDIQPIAMQISKLRFFISLLVEQKIDRNEKNFGVIPLPNLETKFVAANTLLKLNRGGTLQNLFVLQKEEELATVREKYFSARTPKTKRKYRLQDKQLRREIADLLIDDGWDNDAAHKIAKWDPFNQNSKADWFDPEWMFGVEKFDVVIGNPPYVQLQKALPNESGLKYGDLYQKLGYETFARTGDIYCLFYENGFNLIKEKGILSFITSNKWMRTAYGKSIRNYFQKRDVKKVLDLGPGIFESATVDVNILFASGGKNKGKTYKSFKIENRKQVELLDSLEFLDIEAKEDEPWVILSPIEQRIKWKIEEVGTPLKDWDVKINYGIKTGYNPAFIVDKAKRDELIAADPKSAEIIRPILRGRDIGRYKVNFAELYLISTFPSRKYDINNFPAIKAHLLSYGKHRLSQTGEKGTRKKTSHKWFETQDSIAYWDDFSRPKILYPEMTKYINFALDKESHVVNNKVFILTGQHIEYIIAFLNSKLFRFAYLDSFPELQGGTRELRKVFFQWVCLKRVSNDENLIFSSLVNTALNESKLKQQVLDRIDERIFEFYDLSDDEKSAVRKFSFD